MRGVTIYEFQALLAESTKLSAAGEGLHFVPDNVFAWLELQCLRASDEKKTAWLRLTQKSGRRAVQVTSFVGVIRAPDGFQIEVLPKVGKAMTGDTVAARQRLIEMLCCLDAFRHVQTESAKLASTRMPLLEVFISEFLQAVERVVKRGPRSDYTSLQDNRPTLRGKLLIAQNLRHNLCRGDRFFTERDEFSMNRPENRLLHKAVRLTLAISRSRENQQLARELLFVFSNIPVSSQTREDFQRVRLDRGMGHYADALAWARLILEEESPLTGTGDQFATSLLFPMESVFEAFVARHLERQLVRPLVLKTQARSHHLVRHCEQNWFRLKPDLLIRNQGRDIVVLDTKWKLLDARKNNGVDKYGLSQSDFYQLQAYGQSYLNGEGDVVLIYPKTDIFKDPLPVFHLPKVQGLQLWVVPFCLKTRQLFVPSPSPFEHVFKPGNGQETAPK